MTLAREEVFGPVLNVMRMDDLDAAIEIANRSAFGNGAAIFTNSGKAAREFKHRVKAGMVGINVGVPATMAMFPFTGWDESFFGDLHIQGREGVQFYTQQKVTTSRWFGRSGRQHLEREMITTVAEENTTMRAATPQLPAFAHQPQPYRGPSLDEVLRLRREYLNPGIFLYYKKPIMIVEGKMQYVWDEGGRRYLDALGGIVTISVGHCHPHVVEAAASRTRRCSIRPRSISIRTLSATRRSSPRTCRAT